MKSIISNTRNMAAALTDAASKMERIENAIAQLETMTIETATRPGGFEVNLRVRDNRMMAEVTRPAIVGATAMDAIMRFFDVRAGDAAKAARKDLEQQLAAEQANVMMLGVDVEAGCCMCGAPVDAPARDLCDACVAKGDAVAAP